MKKGFLISFIICLAALSSFAGNHNSNTIKGKVVDTNGQPIAGAKVILVESQTQVYTDFDGEFVMMNNRLKEGTIEVSMISFENKKSVLNLTDSNNKNLAIKLFSK